MNPKIFFLALGVFVSSVINAQNVGINTKTPKATLDVVAKSTDASPGVIAPRVTKTQLVGKTYGSAQDGAVVYVTDASGAGDAKTISVTVPGYYYYDHANTKFRTTALFEPVYGQVVSTLANGTTVLNTKNIAVASITLPSNGTYVITYTCRGQHHNTNTVGTIAHMAIYLESGGTLIDNSEVYVGGSAIAGGGSTGTGTLIRTVTAAPETIEMRFKTANGDAQLYNDANGRTMITYVKIAP